MVQGYANTDPDTEMTLFRSDSDKELVMAFPGTASLGDFLTDVSNQLVPANISGVNCPACMVHSGVLKSWNGMQPAAKKVLDDAIAAYPSYKVKLAGHSLGGALTKFAFASFKGLGYDIAAAYSYGEFRVGNAAFADYVDNLSGDTDTTEGLYFRVTHKDGKSSVKAIGALRH